MRRSSMDPAPAFHTRQANGARLPTLRCKKQSVMKNKLAKKICFGVNVGLRGARMACFGVGVGVRGARMACFGVGACNRSTLSTMAGGWHGARVASWRLNGKVLERSSPLDVAFASGS